MIGCLRTHMSASSQILRFILSLLGFVMHLLIKLMFVMSVFLCSSILFEIYYLSGESNLLTSKSKHAMWFPWWYQGTETLAHGQKIDENSNSKIIEVIKSKLNLLQRYYWGEICDTLPAILYHSGKCSKISNTSCLLKGPRQTAQTQSRLLL